MEKSSSTMKNLSSRVFSALAALFVLIAAIYFGGELGIYIIILLATIRSAFEIARMFFNETYPHYVKRLFVFLVTAIFLIITQENMRAMTSVLLITSFVLVASFGVVFHRHFKSLDQILSFIAKNCLGLVYVCFLPATVAWTVQTNQGIEWFLCLLAVVFAGDIGAYVFGVKFGKTKIAPLISPNKSLQGSLGGLLFSTLTACGFLFVLPNTPIYVFIICGFFGGMLGQIGDLFESMIKRVSGVKDSGTIMPGHGGLLDRLDGVLFAAPLFFVISTYFTL